MTNPSPKRLQFNGKFPVLPKLDLGRFWDKGGAKTTLVVVSALVISLLVLAGWMMFFSANAVQVLVDGQEIGLIKDREAAEEALAMLLAEVNQTAASRCLVYFCQEHCQGLFSRFTILDQANLLPIHQYLYGIG